MKKILTSAGLIVTVCLPHHAVAQGGPLTPPDAPAPTMRTLQEIWDKIGALETQTSLLQSQNAQLQSQINLLAAATVKRRGRREKVRRLVAAFALGFARALQRPTRPLSRSAERTRTPAEPA